MPFRKYHVDPERKQGRVKAALSVSQGLCLSDPDAELVLTITLSFDSQPPSREDQPITICTEKSIFDVFEKGEPGVDMFARGAFGRIWSASGDQDKSISLGLFRVNESDVVDSDDLRERGYKFVTIPGDGSPITVTHKLDWERIFRYADGRTKESLNPGEEFSIGFNSQYLGTKWWCWGGLESDLKTKKFHAWRPPYDLEDKPEEDFLRNGNWVLGEEPMTLDWEKVIEGGAATFKIVA